MPLVIPAAGGSSSAAAAEVSAPTEEGQEDVCLSNRQTQMRVRQWRGRVRRVRRSPTLITGTMVKTLAVLEADELAGSRLPDREQLAFHSVAPSSQESEDIVFRYDTTAWPATTFTKAAVTTVMGQQVLIRVIGRIHPILRKSEGCMLRLFIASYLWILPMWGKKALDHVAPPAFFSALRTMDYDQLYTEFNVGAARQICFGAEVRSRAEHELELKEKLKAKYAARGRLLEEKDLEILKLKSQLAEKEAETAEVICLRDQVSSLSGEKSALTAEVSVLMVAVTQKDHEISLLNSRATCLASTMDDAKVACAEAENKITSLASERDRLDSEVSFLRAGFQDFKEKMEILQEEQAQELYNRVAELEAHVMDVSGRLGILGHALGRAVDFVMQEGLEAGYEHRTAGRNLSAVDAYNPEVAKASYINAVKALEDVDFPLVNLLKSKKDAGMDEVLDCFLLDRPLAGLPKAAYLQLCIEQLSIPIHHAGDKIVVGETSMSFALMHVHARVAGAKKHVAALRQLMMEIVSAPLSSQTWVGEASTSVAPLSVEDYDEEDTDEALGSIVAIPKLEICRF
ncbi:hypothetical protein Tco_1346481 [Tanacetum coccineum]